MAVEGNGGDALIHISLSPKYTGFYFIAMHTRIIIIIMSILLPHPLPHSTYMGFYFKLSFDSILLKCWFITSLFQCP